MWMLAHLRITIMVRDWVLSAAMKEAIPTVDEMVSAIRKRHEGLLHPSSSPTREVFEHVEAYMRARVELRLLVRVVETINTERFRAATGEVKTLSLDQQGARFITLGDLLDLTRNCDWSTVVDGKTLRQWLTREAEKYPAWRSPRTRGQGKNIDEFIRVLYRSADDDSGSGLLIRCPATTTKIVPGHRLLQLFAFLAAQAKSRSRGKERGKLVLRDIEQHLYDYGIDFRSSSFGRPLLIEKLMEGGFLVGQPGCRGERGGARHSWNGEGVRMRILSRVLGDLAQKHVAAVLTDERDCRLIFPGLTEALAVELHEELRRRLAKGDDGRGLRNPSIPSA